MHDQTDIVIRPMTDDDLDAVLAIESISFPTPWKKIHFQQELLSPHSFPVVALEGNLLAGYLCLMSLFEEAQILDVAVDPAQRGRGVAQKLIDRAEMLAREKGAEYVALEVRESNLPARRFYEKNGYHISGVRPRYYDGIEDAVLMEKTLD